MKNQTFGDGNDYAKYGMLRGRERMKIAVIRMLTPNDASSHGGRTESLIEVTEDA